MNRIYFLHRYKTSSFISKALCLIITYVVSSLANIVMADDDFLDTCKNKEFQNTYYHLIDNNDIATASVFFHQAPALTPNEEFRFLSLVKQWDKNITYYDFGNLQLLKENKALVHIVDNHLPKYVQREKIKFLEQPNLPESVTDYEVRYYNKKLTLLDKHPLFSRIKRKDRPDLINKLFAISNGKPESISESLKIDSIDKVNLITYFGTPYAAITLSRFTVTDFAIPNISYLLKFEIFHNNLNKSTVDEKNTLNRFLCILDKQFQTQMPHIQSAPWFGYAEYYKYAETILPSRIFFRKFPELFSLGQVFTLVFLGFLFIYLVLGKYSKRTNYRETYRYNKKL
jgi:hypothetical protein